MNRFAWSDGVLAGDEQLAFQQIGVRIYDGQQKVSYIGIRPKTPAGPGPFASLKHGPAQQLSAGFKNRLKYDPVVI